ncbi:MAG: hypothetical protein JW884_01390 [Deltaproteobacteria bacterium]|nr:hypothetical protein [Deltaproteobacteria bacterium]
MRPFGGRCTAAEKLRESPLDAASPFSKTEVHGRAPESLDADSNIWFHGTNPTAPSERSKPLDTRQGVIYTPLVLSISLGAIHRQAGFLRDLDEAVNGPADVGTPAGKKSVLEADSGTGLLMSDVNR